MWRPLRSIVIAFILGWIIWFWIDKHAPVYQMVMQYPGGSELTRDLQMGMNMLKRGEIGPAFVFLWRSHYVLFAALFGMLLSFVIGFFGNHWHQAWRRPRQRRSS